MIPEYQRPGSNAARYIIYRTSIPWSMGEMGIICEVCNKDYDAGLEDEEITCCSKCLFWICRKCWNAEEHRIWDSDEEAEVV
jgi:hypothetical protein